MKGSTKAIIILSAVVVATGGWIVYSQLHGAQDLRDAQDRMRAINEERLAIAADVQGLTKSRDDKQAIITHQAATIAKMGDTIAASAAATGEAHIIAAAAVSQGADLREAFDAGLPLVEAIGQQPLLDWWHLVDGKITIVLETSSRFEFQVAILGPLNAQLAASQVDLLADNGRLEALNTDDAMTLARMRGTVAAQEIDIKDMDAKLQSALGRVQAGEIWIYVLAAVAAAFAVDDIGHRLGAW